LGFAARLANRRPAPRRGQTLSIVREIIVQWLLPIIPATVAEITSRISATTLLASVEPCSAPAVGPLRVFFGHHAARQRGAMFNTSRRPARRFLRPPRCLPAWSHVQHQGSSRSALSSRPPRCLAAWSHVQHQPSARSSLSSATTLLASVEPCSAPAVGQFRAFFGHHAACQRGAMFSTSRRPAPRFLRPPRCLPAWSHVQHQRSSRSSLSSATTLLGSVEPCSAPAVVPLDAFFGHHAACQRGAMFSTSGRHRPSPSHRPATASSILNTAPRWRAAWWRRGRFRGDIWS